MSQPAVSSTSPSPPPARAGREPSYRTRLLVGVCGLVLLTGVAVTAVAHRNARATAEALAGSLFREVSGHAVTRTQDYVLRAEPIAESLGQLADRGLALDDGERLGGQLAAVLRANPGITWVSYGDEAGAFTGAYRPAGGGVRVNRSRIVGGHTHMTEDDVLPDGSWRPFRTDDDSGYDPRQRPFYRKAAEAGRLVWLPPYVFFNQEIPGISCARPVSDGAGRLRGVFSIDFDLHALSDFVAQLSPGEHGRLFLFTADGTLLAHPNQRALAGGGQLLTLADAGDPLVDAFRANLRPEYLRPGDGPAFHAFGLRQGGTDHFASVTTFRVGDDLVWAVGAIAPEDDFLSGVWRSQALALAVAAGAVLVAVLLAAALARRVSGPVQAMVAFMGRVGGGDLSTRADFGGSREFRQLSDALNRMIDDLRDRLRIRHSLQVATEVQQRLLPPGPPTVTGLDVAGHSTYCDETGGDYYDFLVLEEAGPGRLLVALGDVMGHGVAAALIMAGARAVLRDRAVTAGSLAELLGRLNRLLAADLGGERFMTMHLSVIDSAGGFRWASAGHDPALVYDPAADRFDEAKEGGLPLGIVADTEYAEYRLGPLRPGQVVFVGTDGVWEAEDERGEAFGKDRLRDAIRASAAGTAADVVKAVGDRLAAFRGAGKPTDDVTFVVVKMAAADRGR
jgi:sigma-B regulation protein RsbU (phosphoserine phosphatase)